MWPHAKDGNYSVKTGYNYLKQRLDAASPSSANNNNSDKTWKRLWSLYTIPRHKILLWRITQRAIPVRSELSKRGVLCNILCPRCLLKEETIDHAFMQCQHASKIWFDSKLGINFNNSHADFIEWVCYALTTFKDEDLSYLAAITYGIWFARNQKIYELRDIEDSIIIDKANSSIQEFQQAHNINILSQQFLNKISTNNQQQRTHTNTTKKWNRPSDNTIKINSDANLSIAGKWGLGAAFRNSTGELVAAASWEPLGGDEPTLAEACAMYNAIILAIDCGFQEVIFESDCETLVKLLNSNVQCPRNYVGNIVRGIRSNLVFFRHSRVNYIHREANKVAHHLANIAHIEPNTVWINDCPRQLVPTLIRDLIS
jgi:hypothetical protein